MRTDADATYSCRRSGMRNLRDVPGAYIKHDLRNSHTLVVPPLCLFDSPLSPTNPKVSSTMLGIRRTYRITNHLTR